MNALIFLKDVILATLSQMASLFAGIFIFGLLIQFISQLTFRSLEKSFGSKGVYFVAWLGTPIHELGHALFCIIFRHKIAEIRFFKPDPVTGTLGYVYHKWNPANPWQVLGNFFIGVGPVLLGCGVLFAVYFFLIPESSAAWHDIMENVAASENGYSVGGYFSVLGDSSLVLVSSIFTFANLATWQFWVFLYLSMCIASNIRLSWADFKGTLSGLGCLVLPFFLLNLVAAIIGSVSDDIFPFTASSMGVVYSLFVLALIMVIIGFIIIYLVSAAYFRMKYRSVLTPF
ncbi:MAG: hypothetical protein A2Z29_11540 [Chloroflexi bacterium RBG_16_56_11]|nr:MAG: hypothetical protein A2Z29_11540 [Chloroflexi bacterium RBG_16_56_11]